MDKERENKNIVNVKVEELMIWVDYNTELWIALNPK